ncbi:hypothetical protein D3C78_928180 [compost metagenome]
MQLDEGVGHPLWPVAIRPDIIIDDDPAAGHHQVGPGLDIGVGAFVAMVAVHMQHGNSPAVSSVTECLSADLTAATVFHSGLHRRQAQIVHRTIGVRQQIKLEHGQGFVGIDRHAVDQAFLVVLDQVFVGPGIDAQQFADVEATGQAGQDERRLAPPAANFDYIALRCMAEQFAQCTCFFVIAHAGNRLGVAEQSGKLQNAQRGLRFGSPGQW